MSQSLQRLIDWALDPLATYLLRRRTARYLRLAPSLPFRARRFAAHVGPWRTRQVHVPESLRGRPGIGYDSAAADAAFAAAPLQDWSAVHADAVAWLRRRSWWGFVSCTPRLERAVRAADRAALATVQEPLPPAPVDARALTGALKAKAAEIGISEVGVAQYDRRYTFATSERNEFDDRVIVCVLEQNWRAAQTAPSVTSLKSALMGDAQLIELTTQLMTWIRAQGYRARLHELPGETMVLKYAVAAGLGQMGMNGQMLTPSAGSRCRVHTLTTNAPFELDAPIDYGIEKLCDACQVCVRRCPSGAIPARRLPYRGVEKSKLNTARCFPVVAQTHGCGICMRVCPVQRYGLDAVMKEFEASGRVLGKDSDELESYWFDGTYFGPGQRPQLRESWFHPEGFTFDPNRKLPLAGNTGREHATQSAPF